MRHIRSLILVMAGLAIGAGGDGRETRTGREAAVHVVDSDTDIEEENP
jgi:hypothetical protein